MFNPYQRLVLFNQYEILKKSDPDMASTYEEYQEILQAGYTHAYPWLLEHFSEEGVAPETCREVIQILDMYRALQDAPKSESAKANRWATFQGFDGNNEHDHFGFARFLLDKQGKWVELKNTPRNSHSATLSTYRGMLRTWNARGKAFPPTEADWMLCCLNIDFKGPAPAWR